MFSVLLAGIANAQSGRRNVLQSDISGVYKNAVRKGFYDELNHNYSLSKGYHGMAELGYSFGMGDYDFGRFELNTSYGYQFNPYFFIGGGLGLHVISEYNTPGSNIPLDCRNRMVDVPLFANAKVTFLENSITPFIDGRLGYYITHNGGVYTSISAGCRFAIYGRQAINVAIGYSYENLQFESFDSFKSNSSMNYSRYPRNLATHCLSLKLAYEF